MATNVVLLLLLFQVKHFFCDFLLQKPYQYLNKGKYGHPGGLLHTGIQSVGSFVAMQLYSLYAGYKGWSALHATLFLILGEALIHYHVDGLKDHIGQKTGWDSPDSEYYWWLLGADQFIHQATYLLMAWVYVQL